MAETGTQTTTTMAEQGAQTTTTTAEIGTQATASTVIVPEVKTKRWARQVSGPYHQLVREEEEEEEEEGPGQEAGPSAKESKGVRRVKKKQKLLSP